MSRLSGLRSRFFWKIYLTFALLFLAMTFMVSWFVDYRVETTMRRDVNIGLREKLGLLQSDALKSFQGDTSSPQELVQRLSSESDTRITFIELDGTVLADSATDPATLDNHADRPEIVAALNGSVFGESERYSDTLNISMIYVAQAVRQADQLLGVARVALPSQRIADDIYGIRISVYLIVLGGIFIALAIGYILVRRVTVPISEMVRVAEAMRYGNYDFRVKTLTNDELGRLGESLNRMGSELTKQISELKRLESVRRDFVANVSHEIKTPLTSIKGYVETLMEGAIHEPDINLRFLEKIDSNASRLSVLVQDILSLARIEAQEDTVSLSTVRWNVIVDSVLARHEDLINAKGLQIHWDPNEEDFQVLGEREAMIQVCDNLITNAIKYTKEGGSISITLWKKGGWGHLEVEDTGIGIPPKHLSRIFERFYRVDKARSREMGGTGLGLSIVKHLTSSMKGDIAVESEVGVGSRFTVKLRLSNPSEV